MPATNARLIGISEVGHITVVDLADVDVPWGETQKDGVNLQMSMARVDVRSCQGPLKLDSHVTEAGVQMRVAMVESALQQLTSMLALPAANYDDSAGEVLVIDGELGSEEMRLYAEGVGPVSTRRIQAERAVLTDPGALVMADNAYMLPSVTFELLAYLNGEDLELLTITDGV